MLTPGQRLRELRVERFLLKVKFNGKKATKEYIAEFAGVTSKSLTAIEDGITKQPAREIIEAILDILSKFKEVEMMDKYNILAAYGYKAPIVPPSQEEGGRARKNWEQAYEKIWYPAYLVDIIHRLWAWNKYAPRLLGLKYNDPQVKEKFYNVDILDVIFKLAPQHIEITNRADYLPGLIYTMKSQFQPFINEPWYLKWVLDAQNRYPEFKNLWEKTPDNLLAPSTMGNQVPIAIRIKSESEILRFQLTAVGFANDPRFIVAQWIPIDDITAIKCLLWMKQDEEYKVG